MIVRQFLQWVGHAAPADRAEATAALARSYLHAEFSDEEQVAAEDAMLLALDDPSPLVRAALAEVLASSYDAPPGIVQALASDQANIAAIVLARSPLLLDVDLVDLTGAGNAATQSAIASRDYLPCSIAAAMAEVGEAEAWLVMLENRTAEIAPFSFDRLVERFGHLAAMREAMLARRELPISTRQTLLAKLSRSLAGFASANALMDGGRAHRASREACERVTVALAAVTPEEDVRGLVSHLRVTGQLTAGLILRALLSGNIVMFEEALCELSELPPARVAHLLHDPSGKGLRALFAKSELPPSTVQAAWAALSVGAEYGFAYDHASAAHLDRRMVERTLTYCETLGTDEVSDALLVLLRRFALEAAREDARLHREEATYGALEAA